MTTENNTNEKKTPTHIITMLSGEQGKRRYPVRIGSIWETKKGNMRLSFDIVPDAKHLHADVFVAVPYEAKQAEQPEGEFFSDIDEQ